MYHMIGKDSTEDDSFEFTENDKYLITNLININKSYNSKGPTYEEIKRKLINSPGDFKLKEDQIKQQIIEALVREFFQITNNIEGENQIWTPANITNSCEGNKRIADEFGNSFVDDKVLDISTVPSCRIEYSYITANLINLAGTNKITNETTEVINLPEQAVEVDLEESIKAFKIIKSAPKQMSTDYVEGQPELIDLTDTHILLDEDRKGSLHLEDEVKHIKLVAEQESKKDIGTIIKEHWKTEDIYNADNKISDQFVINNFRDTNQQKCENQVKNEIKEVDEFVSMKWEINGDELSIKNMETVVTSKKVVKSESIKNNKLCLLNRKKVMNDKESPFFIDRNLVSVGTYQDGLMYYQWNPTQVMYEICKQSQWSNPSFIKIAYSVKEGFLFLVQINNEEFLGEWSRSVKTAKHSASTAFLQFLGFQFESKSSPVVNFYPAYTKRYETTDRKFEYCRGYKNPQNYRDFTNINNGETWNNSNFNKYHNRMKPPYLRHSYQPYFCKQDRPSWYASHRHSCCSCSCPKRRTRSCCQ